MPSSANPLLLQRAEILPLSNAHTASSPLHRHCSPPMASFLGSPTLLPHPLKRLHLSTSQQQPPRPPPPPQPPLDQSPQQLSSAATPSVRPVQELKAKGSSPSSVPESTDWISSSLTRRFGLGAGLAWAGFLAFGVVSEQVKTRFEAYQQEAETRDVDKEVEVFLPNGIRYYELRVGGGSTPRQGDLVVIDLQGKVQGSNDFFVDTFGGEKKPLALVMGSRPYSKGMCEGVEYVLRRMKAGGKARVVIPPNLGFGDKGADLGSGVQISPSSTLEFVVQVDKVSIAPA